MSLQDWNKGLENFIQLISENYESYPNDKLTERIKELNTKENRIIYVLINPVTRELELFDDMKLLARFHHDGKG